MRIHVPQRLGYDAAVAEQPGHIVGARSWGMREVIAVASLLLTAGVVATHGAAVAEPETTGPAITVVAGNGYPQFTVAAAYVQVNQLVDSDAAPPLTPVVVDGSTATTIPADRGSAVEATATIANHSLPVNRRASAPRWR